MPDPTPEEMMDFVHGLQAQSEAQTWDDPIVNAAVVVRFDPETSSLDVLGPFESPVEAFVWIETGPGEAFNRDARASGDPELSYFVAPMLTPS